MTNQDILSRLNETKTETKRTAFALRWVIMHDGRMGRAGRLYTYAKARSIVARAKRFGVDCYAASFGKVRI